MFYNITARKLISFKVKTVSSFVMNEKKSPLNLTS